MENRTKEVTESQRAMRVLAGAMLAGLLSTTAYAINAPGESRTSEVLSVGLLMAGAAALVGGTLGFLFGIPRTLQQEATASQTEGSGAGASGGAATRRIDYRVNTNLEQISDWLTKILVGVGLTQISEIREGLVSLTSFAAEGLGIGQSGQVFAMGLFCYFAVLGFLLGYLWTRLFLAGALRVADQAAIGELAAEVQKVTEKAVSTERKLEALKEQSERDAAALNLAYRHLNPSPDLPQVTQEDLDAAVAVASRPIKVQIFNQAWQIRSENWRDRDTKPKMERTIAIFRALVRSDANREYHMNHGQLGFALKDKLDPDWAEAEKELSAAIEIRGPWQGNGWLLYEYCRAECQIMLDPDFAANRRSSPERREQIVRDLRAAANVPDIQKIIFDPGTDLHRWKLLNKITEKDLLPES